MRLQRAPPMRFDRRTLHRAAAATIASHDPLKGARRPHQRGESRTPEPPPEGGPPGLRCAGKKRLGSERGQHGGAECREEKDHGRRARELDSGEYRVGDAVERGVPPQCEQHPVCGQEHEEPGEPALVPEVRGEGGEDQDHDAQILAVELEEVATPILAEDPRKGGPDRVEELLGGHGPRRRVPPAVS
jgi:hypothetical protein